MEAPSPRENEIIQRFRASAPLLIERTERAAIWKVSLHGGGVAALKVYDGRGAGNEAPGLDLMLAVEGHGAALILGREADAVLLEWLDGPSLGDRTRDGRDAEAGLELARLASRLHQRLDRVQLDLPTLADWFDGLFKLRIAPECPSQARTDLLRCKAMAAELLDSQTGIRPLHGDLHHDNIRMGRRGYCAFDAKGVLGERTYELANALRNPRGARETVADPRRIIAMTLLWSHEFDVPATRLLAWAAVKCALSISWRCGGRIAADREFGLLHSFLTLLDDWPQRP